MDRSSASLSFRIASGRKGESSKSTWQCAKTTRNWNRVRDLYLTGKGIYGVKEVKSFCSGQLTIKKLKLNAQHLFFRKASQKVAALVGLMQCHVYEDKCFNHAYLRTEKRWQTSHLDQMFSMHERIGGRADQDNSRIPSVSRYRKTTER
ncbi:hypothetical protein TNCV_2104041 [Trichonephila clavipes]|nr:hypothetical protein TNCV_2104041 [Trichonephila clavipes]